MSWITYPWKNGKASTGEDWGFAIGILLFMIYLFIGTAFASDVFMNAIEKICGSTKSVTIVKEEDGVIVKTTKNVHVWNDTVANLTLMALGSSAPEILLSAIETVQGLGDNNPGALGPGTIIGSAAYNLMVISAVCIFSVGTDRLSRIKMYNVFAVTSITSLWAYIWMLIVLEWNTKDVVDIWEGILTLLYFPILVALSYWAHNDFCIGKANQKRESVASSNQSEEGNERQFYFGDEADDLYDSDGHVNKANLQKIYTNLMDIADLTQDEVTSILATKLIQSKKHTRMWYRSQMRRSLMGGAKLLPVLNEKLQEVVDALNSIPPRASHPTAVPTAVQSTVTSADTYLKKAVVEFQAATLAVAEAIGSFNVDIYRTGKEDVSFQIKVESLDGTAKKDVAYKPLVETLTFNPYVKEQKVEVKIFDNVQWNPDSNFYLKLSILPGYEGKAVAGQTHVIEIIIQDDDKPGKLTFAKRGYVFKTSTKIGYVEVVRNNGTDGNVAVSWKTIPGPNCQLMKEVSGKVEFLHKEMKKYIEIPFFPGEGPVEGNNETFDIELHSPEGGAKVGKIPRVTCAITSSDAFKLEITDMMAAALQISEDAEKDDSYKDQILQSYRVNGGDSETATKADWFCHIFTFPYKVTLALIPPTSIMGGWPTFVCALGAVGFLTKLVGDSATAFGEAVGIDPVITAITVVALGTSLPDTFASRISAQNDKTADNAIGNITGSNSVNVFLGLGISWIIGPVYYHIIGRQQGKNTEYCVPAGPLTFNVLVYTLCAGLTLGILVYRRYSPACGRAELGGGTKWKLITALAMISLWFVYVFLSGLQIHLAKDGTDISKFLMISNKKTECARIVEGAKTKSKS